MILVAVIVVAAIHPWRLDTAALSAYMNAVNAPFIIINDAIFCIVELSTINKYRDIVDKKPKHRLISSVM